MPLADHVRRFVGPLTAALVLIGLALPSPVMATPSDPQITLVRAGTPNAVIVWWSRDGSSTASFAASELQSYVQQMSGATLPIVAGQLGPGGGTGTAESGLVVATGGSASEFKSAKIVPAGWVSPGAAMLDGARNDAFAITTVDDDKLVLDGSDQRGTVYAAYELLNRLGVRFFAPDFNYYQGNAERVPREATVATSAISNEQQASLTYRRLYVEEGWSHNATNLVQLIDWMAKSRENILVYPYDYSDEHLTEYDTFRNVVAPELAKRGMVAEVGGHGFTSWLPPDQYPQYYESGYNVFDITNSAALQQYVGNVIDYLRARPEIQIFDAWPPDGARWPPNVIKTYGSLVNAEAYVVQQLTNAVKAQLPGVRIEEIAYTPATAPPDPQYMYDPTDNIIDIAPYDRSYRVPIYDHSAPRNAYYDDLIKQWRQAFSGDVGVYEYYRKYAWHSLPCDTLDLVGAEIPYYQSLGTDGMGMYSEPADWLAYEPLHAEVAALSWNTQLDAASWRQGYLTDRYGAAASAMSTYISNVENACRTIYTSPRGEYNSADAVTQALNDFQAAEQSLKNAGLKTSGGSAAFMVQRLTWSVEFAIADTQISYDADTGDLASMEQAKDQTAALVVAHRFDGVVLENTYSAGRYGGSVTRAGIAAMYRSPAFGFTSPDRQISVRANRSAEVQIAAQSVDYLAHAVHWSAAPPAGINLSSSSGDLNVVGADTKTTDVTVSVAAGTPEGSYDIPVSFVTENGVTLPEATINIVVVGEPKEFASYENNVGVTNDADPAVGNFDGAGNSYSAQALAAVGILPGSQINHDGVTFTWPTAAAGTPDNVVADGQPVALSGRGSILGFLGSASYATTASGTGTIYYSDGTSQRFTLALTGWDISSPTAGNDLLATTAYRNRTNPGNTGAVSVFYAAVSLAPDKTVESVSLPTVSPMATRGTPAMHIFAIGIG